MTADMHRIGGRRIVVLGFAADELIGDFTAPYGGSRSAWARFRPGSPITL
jgi:hypothetical protein